MSRAEQSEHAKQKLTGKYLCITQRLFVCYTDTHITYVCMYALAMYGGICLSKCFFFFICARF